ncbi:xanthine dehydrogenase accessory protein XdhC [Vibrio hannami]|uniref:xanthine dehydrogenase accessory protein XdhC n=1 Tax=Vibrio hannami TaxID=2717094 RepID=UPI00240F6975|nr:xanthine dehydrogenase accessory protein XdhC [Vibrio hannami]MDG3085246.1 xanthine dehydrogenase accessory protein XdhC [Vibrio hannami]
MSFRTSELFSNPGQDWLSACKWLTQQGEPYCIATVLADVGSVPRSAGSKMVISATHQYATLGGGNLEFEVIKKAREGLTSSSQSVLVERFSLAADLGQCCGGAVQVLFEFMQTNLPRVVIFGAGHVCQSLSSILKELPCHLTVVDNRSEWLKPLKDAGINTLLHQEPEVVLDTISEESHLVIMTQDHALDYRITFKALEKACYPFIGLIGSAGKKKRFEFRLGEELSHPELLNQLTCPIGHPDILGKLPMQVAVSVSAQLMSYFQQHEAKPDNRDAKWNSANQLRKSLREGAE